MNGLKEVFKEYETAELQLKLQRNELIPALAVLARAILEERNADIPVPMTDEAK